MNRSALLESSTSQPQRAGARRVSLRTRRRLALLLTFTLVVGAVATLIEVIPNNANRLNTPISTTPAQVVPQEKPVPPDPAAERIGRRFIETAVERTDLDWAYDHVHPYLKGRMTRAAWDTGSIPVIPYPATNAATTAFMVDYSYRTEVLYEVELNARPGSGIRPMVFFLGLRRAGGRPRGRWLVCYWQPHWRPPVPYTG